MLFQVTKLYNAICPCQRVTTISTIFVLRGAPVVDCNNFKNFYDSARRRRKRFLTSFLSRYSMSE